MVFLTDDCGVGSYFVATLKAVQNGVGGDVWGSSQVSVNAMWSGDSIEGRVIGSIIGSGVGVKMVYNGLAADTTVCSS